jgi:hypothetical protein
MRFGSVAQKKETETRKDVSGIFGAWYNPNNDSINSCVNIQLLISLPVYLRLRRRKARSLLTRR